MTTPHDETTALQQELERCKASLEMAELMLREQSEELNETNQALRKTSDELLELRRKSLESQTRERAAIADADAAELVRGIVETVPDAILTADQRGVISMVNPAAEQMFGCSRKSLEGLALTELMPDAFEDAAESLPIYLKSGDATVLDVEREITALRRDGSQFPIEISVGRFNTGEKHMFAAVIRDITERKAAEHKLAQTQQQLAQAEKMASLGGLVAGVAHEINTPVGIGVTAASTLRERAEKLQADFAAGKIRKSDFEDFLSISTGSSELILDNLERVAHLVQSFKQLAVVGTGGDQRQFNLKAQLAEAIAMRKDTMANRGILIELDCPTGIELLSYPADLLDVLIELLDNAANHAFEPTSGGTVSIAATTGGRGALITVRDNGKGVPAADLGRVFEPFFTTRRTQGGGGLGLHVVFNLVTASLGGMITAQHAQPGTAFVVDLPLQFTQVNADQPDA